MRKLFSGLVGAGMLACTAGMSLAATQYNVVYLGNFTPTAVNASGQVVGTSISFAGDTSYLYSGGTLTTLGSLGGGNTDANAINDSGKIGGASVTSGGATHAFIYSGGSFTDVGTLPGGATSTGTALSNGGKLVGFGTNTANYAPVHALSYDSTNGIKDLGVITSGTSSRAYAISSAGHIAGDAYNGGTHAIVIAPNSTTLTDIGSLNNSNTQIQSTAYGVNGSGTVVGGSQTSQGGNFLPFVYTSGGGMVNVSPAGIAGGQLSGINDSGQAVGYTYDDTYTNKAILYANGMITDLNTLISPTSGWTLDQATAVSSTGYIVGSGTYNGTSNVAFALVPVPEPVAGAFLGLGGLLLRRRCRNGR